MLLRGKTASLSLPVVLRVTSLTLKINARNRLQYLCAAITYTITNSMSVRSIRLSRLRRDILGRGLIWLFVIRSSVLRLFRGRGHVIKLVTGERKSFINNF